MPIWSEEVGRVLTCGVVYWLACWAVNQYVGVQIHLRHLANLGVNDYKLLMARSLGEGEDYFDAPQPR